MQAESTFARRPHTRIANAPQIEPPRVLTCEERWQRDMLDLRLALYKRSNLVRENLVSDHAWERNAQPERNHVSMAEVIHALLHRDAHIISEHLSPLGPVRVIEGYTWEGTRLHIVVGLNRGGGRRVSLITYWDPAIPPSREPNLPTPRAVRPAPAGLQLRTAPAAVAASALADEGESASRAPAPTWGTALRRALAGLWQGLLRLSRRARHRPT